MDLWTELPPEWKAIAFVGLVAALGLVLELLRSRREAANARLLSEFELKRDQVARERRRQLRIQQKRRV